MGRLHRADNIKRKHESTSWRHWLHPTSPNVTINCVPPFQQQFRILSPFWNRRTGSRSRLEQEGKTPVPAGGLRLVRIHWRKPARAMLPLPAQQGDGRNNGITQRKRPGRTRTNGLKCHAHKNPETLIELIFNQPNWTEFVPKCLVPHGGTTAFCWFTEPWGLQLSTLELGPLNWARQKLQPGRQD